MSVVKPVIIKPNGEKEEINSSDTISPNNLGTGTANTSNFLRGDGTWQTIPGGYNITSGTASPTGGNDGDIYLQYI